MRLYYLYRDFGVQETGKSVNFAALQKVYKIIERKIGKGLHSFRKDAIIYKRNCNRYAMKRKVAGGMSGNFRGVCPI